MVNIERKPFAIDQLSGYDNGSSVEQRFRDHKNSHRSENGWKTVRSAALVNVSLHWLHKSLNLEHLVVNVPMKGFLPII